MLANGLPKPIRCYVDLNYDCELHGFDTIVPNNTLKKVGWC